MENHVTVETTIHLTDQHLRFLHDQVRRGAFVSLDAAVAAALDQMMADEAGRETALETAANDIRARLETPRDRYQDNDRTFAEARRRVDTERD